MAGWPDPDGVYQTNTRVLPVPRFRGPGTTNLTNAADASVRPLLPITVGYK
jgi:hypothetical protein